MPNGYHLVSRDAQMMIESLQQMLKSKTSLDRKKLHDKRRYRGIRPRSLEKRNGPQYQENVNKTIHCNENLFRSIQR